MVDAPPVAVPVAASAIVDELLALRVRHVVNVPDTHQRTLLAELARQSQIQVLTASTEDEAVAVSWLRLRARTAGSRRFGSGAATSRQPLALAGGY